MGAALFARSLSARIVAVIAAFLFAGVWGISIASYFQTRQLLQSETESDGRLLATTMSYAIEARLSDKGETGASTAGIQRLVENAARGRKVSRMVVFGRAGELIADSNQFKPLPESSQSTVDRAMGERTLVVEHRPKESRTLFAVPLLGGRYFPGKPQPDVSAVLWFQIDTSGIRAKLWRLTIQRFTLDLCVAMLMAIPLFAMLHRLVVRPAQRLASQVVRLGSGDPTARSGVRLPAGGGNEIQQLAQAFDRMAEAMTEKEKALRSVTDRLSVLLENISDAVVFENDRRQIVYVNSTFCKLFGLSQSPADLFGADASTIMAQAQQFFPNPSGFVSRIEAMIRVNETVRGEELAMVDGRTFERDFVPVTIDGAVGHLWQYRDVSDSKRLEVELRQSQKMEAVGQLAGGIAHDFNNLLTVIVGHSDLLLECNELSPDLRESAEAIAGSADRAAVLTRQLLTFSRRQVMEAKPIDFNAIVEHLSRLLQRSLGEHISLRTGFAADLPRAVADQGMVEQALVNLAVNARDAMPCGGSLSIQTGEITFGADEVFSHPDANPGRYVCVTVSDNGSGIPAHVLPHIFDPFFTTKEVGKGTGLGLSMVYGILKQHEGWIEVESEMDKGTVFRLYFPAVEMLTPEAAKPKPPCIPLGGREVILLVEDEYAVRDLTRRFLLQLGYEVLTAASGPEALVIWQEHSPRIKLVVTDIVMPEGLSGFEIAQRMRATHPDLAILFITGYSPDAIVADFPGADPDTLLRKPFLPRDLADAVRACLDRPTVRSAMPGSRR